MNCSRCGEEMSIYGETQVFETTGTDVLYTDKYGNRDHATGHYVKDLLVTYECDGPRGCESRFVWSRKTRRLTLENPGPEPREEAA